MTVAKSNWNINLQVVSWVKHHAVNHSWMCNHIFRNSTLKYIFHALQSSEVISSSINIIRKLAAIFCHRMKRKALPTRDYNQITKKKDYPIFFGLDLLTTILDPVFFLCINRHHIFFFLTYMRWSGFAQISSSRILVQQFRLVGREATGKSFYIINRVARIHLIHSPSWSTATTAAKGFLAIICRLLDDITWAGTCITFLFF